MDCVALPHAEIMQVNMLARGNRNDGDADDLAIFETGSPRLIAVTATLWPLGISARALMPHRPIDDPLAIGARATATLSRALSRIVGSTNVSVDMDAS